MVISTICIIFPLYVNLLQMLELKFSAVSFHKTLQFELGGQLDRTVFINVVGNLEFMLRNKGNGDKVLSLSGR